MFLVAPYGAEIPQLRWGQRKKAGEQRKIRLVHRHGGAAAATVLPYKFA